MRIEPAGKIAIESPGNDGVEGGLETGHGFGAGAGALGLGLLAGLGFGHLPAIVAEGFEGAGHVAQFIADPGAGDFDVIVAFREAAHGAGEAANGAAQPAGGDHGHGNAGKQADKTNRHDDPGLQLLLGLDLRAQGVLRLLGPVAHGIVELAHGQAQVAQLRGFGRGVGIGPGSDGGDQLGEGGVILLGLSRDRVDGVDRDGVVKEEGEAICVGRADIKDHLADAVGALARRLTQIVGEIHPQGFDVADIIIDFQGLARCLPVLAEHGFGRECHQDGGRGNHENDRNNADEGGIDAGFDTGKALHWEFSVVIHKFHRRR